MAESIKIHEIGKKENVVSGEFPFMFFRKDVEGKTSEEIRQLVAKQIMELGKLLFGILMAKKKEWEAETKRFEKFLDKDN